MNSMKFEIVNFRACRSASFNVDGVTLIGGRNEAGKTSLCQAVAATMTGNAAIGTTKSNAQSLVTDGSEGRSWAALATERGATTVEWPGCSVTSTGYPPGASVHAVGLVDVCDMQPKERAAALISILGADPTEEDLSHALGDAVRIETAKNVWEEVQAHGWDGALERARANGASLKGRWREVTGDQYGTRKADAWTPAVHVDESTLDKREHEAAREYDAAVGKKAVGKHMRAQFESAIAAGKAAESNLADVQAKYDAAVADQSAAQAAYSACPAVEGFSGAPCPECGTIVRQGKDEHGGIIIERVALATSVQENERRSKERAALQKALAEATGALERASRARGECMGAISNGKAAAASIEKIADGGTSIDDAKAVLDAVKKERAALEATRRAREIHNEISETISVVRVLSPDGVRRACLESALADFNASVEGMAKVAGWEAPSVSIDMDIMRGGYAFYALSKSAQFRVSTMFRIAIAKATKSDVVVIDAADILDAPGRNGLIRMLQKIGIPSIVTMTYGKRESMPDMAMAKVGNSYWLNGGVIA